MDTQAKQRFFLFRWIDHLAEFGGWTSALCLAGVTLIITLDVFMRYVMKAPTTWVAEMSVYLTMAVGMFGAAYALKNNSHFCITFVVDKLSAKNRRRLKLFTHGMGIAYCLVFVVKGTEMAKFSYEIEDVSRGLMETPLWIPNALIPIGGLLLVLQFINKLVEEFRAVPQEQEARAEHGRVSLKNVEVEL